jgi:hypothetical protein
MSAFAIVVIVVCVIALAIALRYFGGFGEIGRGGRGWVEHDQNVPISERPSEEELDSPLPKRPLRGRAE